MSARHRRRDWLSAAAVALVLHAAWLVDGPAATSWRTAGPATPPGTAAAPLVVRRLDAGPSGTPGIAKATTVPAPPSVRPGTSPRTPGPAPPLLPSTRSPAAEVAPPSTAEAATEAAPGAADVTPARAVDGSVPPTYRTRLPPPFRRAYALERDGRVGAAELAFDADADSYRLVLHSRVAGRPDAALVSRGGIDANGLAPERFAQALRGRERQAAHFDRAAALISYSGPPARHVLLPGAQDRLSWLVQLAAVLDAEAAAPRDGREIHLPVSGARGDAGVWTFVVQGEAPVPSADGRMRPALHLVREPTRPYDTRAEVWLDPADHHLPLRVRLDHPPGSGGLELRLTETAASP